MRIARERIGDTLLISMIRPGKRNAVDAQMALELSAALDELDDNPELRVGVLTGTGEVFCAGSDVFDSGEKSTERGGEYGVIRRRRRKPLVAAVEGAALGGGMEIVLSCDLVAASTNATFGLPETRRGLVATSGALFRAPRVLPANIAAELLLAGRLLSAERAYQLGLVNVVTDRGAAVSGALELARDIALAGPIGIEHSVLAIQRYVRAEDEQGWADTAVAMSAVVGSLDALEGVAAFRERREPRWEGR
jgi:enoyl-CoA hydratase